MSNIYSGLGWKHNIEFNCEHLHEVAYSLAEKGFTLRTNGAKGASSAMIAGVQRFCKNRKLDVSNYLEVYLPAPKHNGYIADQPGFYNVHQMPNFKESLKYSENAYKYKMHDTPTAEKSLQTCPYVAFGRDLSSPIGFLIMDVNLYKLNSESTIYDAQGYAGQVIRLVRARWTKTRVFNYAYKEHRIKINGLLNNAQ